MTLYILHYDAGKGMRQFEDRALSNIENHADSLIHTQIGVTFFPLQTELGPASLEARARFRSEVRRHIPHRELNNWLFNCHRAEDHVYQQWCFTCEAYYMGVKK